MNTLTKRAVPALAVAAIAAILTVGLGCGRAEDPAAPAEGEAPQRAPQARPEPWEYDEARDRHWHPGHGHWHAGPPPERAEAPPADAQERAEASDLRWHTSLPEALEAARQAENLVLVEAYAEWCGWCKKFEAETLSHPDVQERLKGFTLLKIDTDEQGELAQRLGVTGLPTVLILNAEGDVVLRQAGFAPPEAFLEFLAQAGGNGENGDAPKAAADVRGSPLEAAASAEETSPLKPGDPVPSATVADMDGRPVELPALVAAKPTVFVFYRGGWCPYCTVHLGALGTIEPRLAELGYQILAISPERPQKVAETGEEGGFRYQLLSDSETEAARGFGVAFKVDEATAQRYQENDIDLGTAPGSARRLLTVPSVFIAGTDGVIKYAHSDPDYTVRLEPEKVVAAAEAAIE